MTLLLDTCTLLWLTFEPQRISEKAAGALNQNGITVHVSAVTAWEIGIKAAKGKLGLPRPVSRWFPEVVAHYRLIEIPITADVAARSTELPSLHADPFDRLLIATALSGQLSLVTADRTIPTYPGLKTLW